MAPRSILSTLVRYNNSGFDYHNMLSRKTLLFISHVRKLFQSYIVMLFMCFSNFRNNITIVKTSFIASNVINILKHF